MTFCLQFSRRRSRLFEDGYSRLRRAGPARGLREYCPAWSRYRWRCPLCPVPRSTHTRSHHECNAGSRLPSVPGCSRISGWHDWATAAVGWHICQATAICNLVPPTPFVSVVTVSLNATHTIADTIASVAKQDTAFALEHICVDGGSVDGTRVLIDAWAARSNHIVRIYEPDTGIFDAMNKGLRAARGEYVVFLNADDFFVAPDSVANAMAGLEPGGQGNPDLVVGNVAVGTPVYGGFGGICSCPGCLGTYAAGGCFRCIRRNSPSVAS